VPKTVVITGATGFIGRHLCRRLVQDGYDVVALTRNPVRGRDILGDQVVAVEWDGLSAEGWAEYAEGASAIVNLAGENIGAGRWTEEKKRRILHSRLHAGKAVVEAVERVQHKPRAVIQASGIGVYGDRGDELCDETTPFGKGFLPDIGRQWEASTREVARCGVRHVVIRTGVVLDREEGFLPRVVLPFRLFVGGHFGSGRQWLSWIHIQDEIRAIQFLIENENTAGLFNLSSPNPLSSKEFSKILGGIMKKPSWLPVPSFLFRLLFGEMAEALILTGQRSVPKRLLKEGFAFRYVDLEPALCEILFHP
jgi:uncharacterized protein (TIGR01777 family)